MNDSLLHRWSKQKSQTKDQPESDQLPSSGSAAAETSQSAIAAVEDSESGDSEVVELPALESLNEDSDYSMFMSPQVEEGVRKLALRKLFKSPIFNVVDGLNDYDDDFTTFEALGDIVTSDMKFHEERKKAEQAAKEREMAESSESAQTDDVEASSSDVETGAEPTSEDGQDEQKQDEAIMKNQGVNEQNAVEHPTTD